MQLVAETPPAVEVNTEQSQVTDSVSVHQFEVTVANLTQQISVLEVKLWKLVFNCIYKHI